MLSTPIRMQSDIIRARKRLCGATTAFVINVLFVTALVVACLHVFNEYPRHYTPNVMTRDSGILVWNHCQQHPIINNPVYSRCDVARQHAEMNVRFVSIEQTIIACLPTFGLLSSSSPHTVVGYVLLKTIDNIASSLMLVSLVVLAVIGWVAWTFVTGPLKGYNSLQMLAQGRVHDAANIHTIDLTRQEGHPYKLK
jgi:hypothetical protein